MISKLENVQLYQILALIVCQEILTVVRIVDGGKMNVMMTFQIGVMELQESSRIIANKHVAIVSVKIKRIVRWIYQIAFKDIAMLAYRIRTARMEELVGMVNALVSKMHVCQVGKNLMEYIVKNVMTLQDFVLKPSLLPSYLYKVTVM